VKKKEEFSIYSIVTLEAYDIPLTDFKKKNEFSS